MNITAIRVFLEIVKTHSLSKAAENLYLSQSTVSHHLKTMEAELNSQLIIRHQGQRTIHLTPKGENFLPLAERWLSLFKDTQALQDMRPHSTLSLGCTDSLNTYVFPELYQNLLSHEETLDLDIRTQHSQEIYNLLLNHEIDTGFVITSFAYKNVVTRILFTEPMVLLCQKDMPFPSASIHPQDLDVKKEIFIDWSPEFRAWHDFWLNTVTSPRIKFNNPSLSHYFLKNNYWSIFPISMARLLLKEMDLAVYPLTSPPPDRTIYQITHKEPLSNHIPVLTTFQKYVTYFQETTTLFQKL